MPAVTPAADRTANARAEHLRRAAIRALDDPRKLASAARIVSVALERQRLTLGDLGVEGAGDVA